MPVAGVLDPFLHLLGLSVLKIKDGGPSSGNSGFLHRIRTRTNSAENGIEHKSINQKMYF